MLKTGANFDEKDTNNSRNQVQWKGYGRCMYKLQQQMEEITKKTKI